MTFSFPQLEIGKKEHARIRLVIAIPALMILISLTAGIISYEVVMNLVDKVEFVLHKKALEKTANLILIANFVACVVALLFGVGLATYIIRPIRALTKGAQKVANGDLSMKVSIPYSDELGDLGESFNSLISHLNNLFKERNRFILEGFSEGLISIGAEGEIQAINTQAENIIGLNADHVIGSHCGEIFGSLQENFYLNDFLVQSLKKSSRQSLNNVGFVNSLGKRFNLSVRSSPIIDKKGNPIGSIIAFRDLSILALFTEQIQQADRLAAIGSFATGIAHEIRNPLGSIKGLAQLLAENPEPEKGKKYCDLIVSQVSRLNAVIQTILNFAHPEPEENVPTDVSDLILKALNDAMSYPSVEKILPNITVEKNLNQTARCIVQPNRILQAFTNIIINAFQAVEPGGKVQISTFAANDADGQEYVQVDIVDDGNPIPSDQIDKIFEPFFTTRSEGTGLGLPIAYQIIISNGGAVEVQSKPDKTVFIIRLGNLSRKTIL